HLFRWQVTALLTLWVGYAGYYVCRSDLSVAGPLLQEELAQEPPGPVEQWLRDGREAVSRLMTGAIDRVRGLIGLPKTRAVEAGAKREESTGKRRFGLIASVSIFFYALGKLFGGMVADFVGGRRMFLFGMLASVACTVLFGVATGFAALLAIWSANRMV